MGVGGHAHAHCVALLVFIRRSFPVRFLRIEINFDNSKCLANRTRIRGRTFVLRPRKLVKPKFLSYTIMHDALRLGMD